MVLLLLLTACSDPISNRLFYEDGDFVQALPSEDRLRPPRVLATATVGDATLQQAAVEQSELLATALEPLALTGSTLRTTAPDVRSDVFRGWEAVPVVGDNGGRWWVGAEVGQTEDGVRTWLIDWSLDAEGPYITLARGQHTGQSTGLFSYDIDDDGITRQVGGRYGLEPSGASNLELGVGLGPNNGELYWKVIGDSTLIWTGVFDVGAFVPRPGVAMVVQDLDGGRGEMFTTGNDAVFIAQCWDASGAVVWDLAGDGSEVGDEALCALGPLFE